MHSCAHARPRAAGTDGERQEMGVAFIITIVIASSSNSTSTIMRTGLVVAGIGSRTARRIDAAVKGKPQTS